jgi:hypothetical protein
VPQVTNSRTLPYRLARKTSWTCICGAVVAGEHENNKGGDDDRKGDDCMVGAVKMSIVV